MDTFVAPVILFLVFVGAAYYVLVPFLSGKVITVGDEAATRSKALELRKINLYKQIREAEFVREMGLINEEDFERTRVDLITEVADMVGELEGASVSGKVLDDMVSAPAAPSCPSCKAPLTPGARYCSQCGTEAAPPMAGCPGCGAVAAPGDRFCANCGRGLLN